MLGGDNNGSSRGPAVSGAPRLMSRSWDQHGSGAGAFAAKHEVDDLRNGLGGVDVTDSLPRRARGLRRLAQDLAEPVLSSAAARANDGPR